jgi:hypothetical protein
MPNCHPVERRAESRTGGSFPALALDVTGSDQKLGVYTMLENFSASGFYMRLARPVEPGAGLLVITQISQAIVLLQGSVVRVEELEGGAYGMAVVIAQHQIFSLRSNQQQTQAVPVAAEPLRTQV